jgi:hypothetical protein
MLSRLDDIIYPNRCEVIEIEASQRYIYPIYKNGRSSFLHHALINNYKTLINNQVNKVQQIHIVLRDPKERFVSGVNTFVFNTKRDNPKLDIDTILYFVENYLFLNRHYAPQLSWIINLSKFTSAKLTLHNLDFVTEITGINFKPTGEEKILSADVIKRLENNPHNEMYIRLDSLLLDLIGQTLTFKEILNYLKIKDPVAYSTLSCTVLD